MSLDEIKAEDRRAVILQLLAKDDNESASDSMLERALDSLGTALRASLDQVRTDIVWLKQQGLVTVEEVGIYTVTTLTRQGRDVADGKIRAPGVSRRSRGR